LLFLAQCCFYCCFLPNIIAFPFIRLEHNLFKYLLLHHDVDVPCS
jgi:hypothetical protein